MSMYLIDTNVMLAASSIHELSNVATRAMPREIELREFVAEWLLTFDESDHKIVLDEEGLIRDEYERNLPFNYPDQEYGMQVLQNKLDQVLYELVPIEVLDGNGERIAVLAHEHEALVPDREDRKWVASALASIELYEHSPPIVYGAETDWYIAEAQLTAVGVQFERLLPEEWYQDHLGD